jgi:hypothetical protein
MNQQEILTWEDIKACYPDEWVVIENPVFDGMKIIEGIVTGHNPDKKIACIEGGQNRSSERTVTLTYTGKLPKAGFQDYVIRRRMMYGWFK